MTGRRIARRIALSYPGKVWQSGAMSVAPGAFTSFPDPATRRARARVGGATFVTFREPCHRRRGLPA